MVKCMKNSCFKNLNFLFLLAALSVFSLENIAAQEDKTLTREGNNLFKKEKYNEAEISYRKALEKNKNMPEATFNLGDAVYEQKRFDEATKQFEQSAKTATDNSIKAKAFHNLGNSYLSQKKYEEAANAFKSSLKLNPKDADTRYNLAYANAMLHQQQQDQNKQNKDNKNDQKDNKDQQNKDNKKDQNKDNKNNDQQNQNDQQQADNKENKQQQPQPKLSKEDAEKLLQALQNEEQKANQKVQKANAKPANVKVEKDW